MAEAIKRSVIAVLLIVAAVLLGYITDIALDRHERASYPTKYSEYVEKYSEMYGVPKDVIYAVIKAESDFDLIYTNPPYMKTTSGKANVMDKKNIARHEVFGGISDFCEAGKRLLKFGGSFYAVYRPDRLCDLVFEMRTAGIEPKRMTFVHATQSAEPSMVLIEGRLGGKAGLFLTKPLIIYKNRQTNDYSDDMNYIMENGSFPREFVKR